MTKHAPYFWKTEIMVGALTSLREGLFFTLKRANYFVKTTSVYFFHVNKRRAYCGAQRMVYITFLFIEEEFSHRIDRI